MVTIMCSNRLRQAIVRTGERRTIEPASRSARPGRLGNWVATLVSDGQVVVAHNERTSLTLLFPFPAAGGLRHAFASMLRETLRECGVAAGLIAVECTELKGAAFVALGSSPLVSSLDFAAIETATHARYQSLRSIQDMLNTSGIERYVPAEAIAELFDVGKPRTVSAR